MSGGCKCPLNYIYFRQGGYIMPSVCLFVCLSVCFSNFRWNYWSDLHENCIPMDTEDMFTFRKSSASGSGSRDFRTILQHCEIGHSSTLFRHFYLWTNWSDLRENFTTNVTLNKEVPVKFWKSDLYPDSGYALRIRTRFALAETCAFLVLLLSEWL